MAFALPCAVLITYALRGGSYDIVLRQEEAVVLWLGLAAGFASGVVPRRVPDRRALVAVGALIGLTAWTALSLTWSESSEATVGELARVLHYLGLLVAVFVLAGRATWRPAAAGLATGAIVVCILAVLSRLTTWFGDDVAQTLYLSQNRLSYPFNYWNALAAWGAMTVSMALAFSAHARTTVVRAAFLAAVPTCILATYLTYSRAGVISTGIGVLAVLVLSPNRWVVAVHAIAAGAASAIAIATMRDQRELVDAVSTNGASDVIFALVAGGALCAAVVGLTRLVRGDYRWRVKPNLARFGVAAIVVTVLIAAVTVARAPIAQAWEEFRNQDVATSTADDPAARLGSFRGSRYEVWQTATDSVDRHPLGGSGAGTFEFTWNRDGGGVFLRDAHSLYLEAASELGLVGLMLVIALLGGLLLVAFHARADLKRPHAAGASAGLIACFVVFAFHAGVDWIWESTAVTVLGLLAVAIAGSAGGTRRVNVGLAARIGLTVAALVAAAAQVPGLLATSRVRESQQAVRTGDLAGAGERADAAVEAAPWAASPYVQRALIAERQGRLDAARADLREGILNEPDNWRHRLILARVQAKAGRVDAARESLSDAKRLRPKSSFLRPLAPRVENRPKRAPVPRESARPRYPGPRQ